jgi:hypothetical protein
MTIPQRPPSRRGSSGSLSGSPAAARRAISSSEHQEQKALIQWCALQHKRLPGIERLYAIPNGGSRSKATAGKLKAEGVRKGVFDLCLPVARGGFFGLYIEMKSSDGSVSPEQRVEYDRLWRDGYFADVCFGMDQARYRIEWYLRRIHTQVDERVIPVGYPKDPTLP